MTDFKTLKSIPVKTISGDRAGASFEGQLYYDSDGVGIFKFVGALAAGTWASGGTLVSGNRRNAAVSCGVQAAALIAGGYRSDSPAGNTVFTEVYNGSSWSEVADLNSARAFGNGSTNGTTTATIAAGGNNPDDAATDLVELWNGTGWSEIAELNTARKETPGGAGISTSTLIFGGNVPVTVNTESWNGASWTIVASLATGREALGNNSAGSASAGLIGGGSTGGASRTNATEEWTVPASTATAKTFTSS